MPVVTAEAFQRLNLMAGTIRSLEQKALSPDDSAIWNRDFKLICDDLQKLVDPELGADLRSEEAFYMAAAQVAKGYFDGHPFGGLKSATGQFGCRLAIAQDLKTAATATTAKMYSWMQTGPATTASTSKVVKLIGAGAAVYTCSAVNQQEVLAFHRLISYKPSPRIIAVVFTINDYPYPPYTVEPFSKIGKADKLFKILPIPGRVILPPGASIYIDAYIEAEETTSLTGSLSLDYEVGLFGLVFGEYDYLKDAEID